MSRTDGPALRIAQYRASGMADDVIAQRLILEGWAPEDVQHLSHHDALPAAAPTIAPESTPTPAVSNVARPDTRRRSVLTFGAILCACLTSIASLYLYLNPRAVYSISVPQAATSTPPLEYGALPALSDPQYYGDTIASLVSAGASFVDANLSSMQLIVYLDGAPALEVPIAAKGKVGSWWETPAGIYKIQTKEENHLSSFGDVYMPYSMDFQGNFFIHGWPYYANGTPVSSSYSGGCIRLSTADAERVFKLAKIGMPVVVYNEAPARDPFAYQLKGPVVSASNYLVADLTNHTVLMSYGASSTAPIASITKLVTALVATEYINLDKELTVPQGAIVYTSVPRLRVGESYRAYDLLFLLLQESSNEAAETLARSIGRERFVALMNDKARAIGLTHTLFSDPSGAKNDLSTPEDLFSLLKYIHSNRRFVFSITAGTLADSAYGTPAFGKIGNFNVLKNVPGTFVGGKIGQTNQAGETYAGVYNVRIGAEDRLIAAVVLGSKDAPADVVKLLTFVRSQYAPAASLPTE